METWQQNEANLWPVLAKFSGQFWYFVMQACCWEEHPTKFNRSWISYNRPVNWYVQFVKVVYNFYGLKYTETPISFYRETGQEVKLKAVSHISVKLMKFKASSES